MDTRQRIGGVATLVEAESFIVGIVMLVTVRSSGVRSGGGASAGVCPV